MIVLILFFAFIVGQIIWIGEKDNIDKLIFISMKNEIKNRTSKGYGIVVFMICLAMGVMFLGCFASCNTTKHANKTKTYTDSTGTIDYEERILTHEISGEDTTIHTDADTLSGHADVETETDTAVIESDEQQIQVTKTKGKKGVNVRAIAKSKPVVINTKKEITTADIITQRATTTLSKSEVIKTKDKERTTPWYVWGGIILVSALVLVFLFRKWIWK